MTVLDNLKKSVLLASLVIGTIFSGVIYSLQAPFFPTEAKKKAISPSEYGVVFAALPLASFIMSFPSGWLLSRIGAKVIVTCGMFLSGLCAMVFGFVIYLTSKTSFLGVSILCRVLEGVGQSFITIGVMTVVMLYMADSAATILSWTRSSFGLGMIVGPALGGVLYDLGGFLLPFELLGGLSLLLLPLLYFVIPKADSKNDTTKSRGVKSPFAILKLLKIWFSVANLFLMMMLSEFFSVTLEPHLSVFQLSGTFKGLVFLSQALAFALTSISVGMLCDKGVPPIYFITGGSILVICGLSLIGPVAVIPLQPSLFLIVPGMLLCGIGFGGQVVPSYMFMKQLCLRNGFPDDIQTNGMISATYKSSSSFGGVIGPTVGGVLYDAIGFRYAEIVFIGSYMILSLSGICLCFKELKQQTEKDAAGEAEVITTEKRLIDETEYIAVSSVHMPLVATNSNISYQYTIKRSKTLPVKRRVDPKVLMKRRAISYA